MEKSESLNQLIPAVIKVMADVKGIEKNLTVGTGNNTYKGVADQDVKKIIGASMEQNGLVILPVGIEESTQIDSWDETGGQYGPKRKQLVFTKVTTTYMLCHASGEYITLKGYGHGVDSQDKSAGKATTYALKYALLYMFMVPTGKIDDADNTHSEDIPQAQKPKPEEIAERANILPWLNPETSQWTEAVKFLKNGGIMSKILTKYRISKSNQELLLNNAME